MTLRLHHLLADCACFNGSCLLEEYAWLNRIMGTEQHGDIVLRHLDEKGEVTVTVDYRVGDEALVEAMEAELRPHLTPRPNPPLLSDNRMPGMAPFFQMIQGRPLGRKVVIADSAIESAHAVFFKHYQSAYEELEFLGQLRALKVSRATKSLNIRNRYYFAMLDRGNRLACLHQGRRIFLPHLVHAPDDEDGRALIIYFGLLPSGKPLVGLVEERPY